MSALNIVAGVINIVVGLMFIGICIPLTRGGIQRNAAYGFRFRRAFQSEEDWQRINTYGARWMIRWSLLLLILGVIAFFVPMSNIVAILWIILPTLIVPLIAVGQTYAYAKQG